MPGPYICVNVVQGMPRTARAGLPEFLASMEGEPISTFGVLCIAGM